MGTRLRRFLWLLALVLLLLPTTAAAWSGKVVGVTDGDTITVLHAGRGERIRLYGIDCPEKRQAFGTKAKRATSALTYRKIAEVEPVDQDRYGRTVGLVTVGDTLVNEELIRQGLARLFTRYCDQLVCEGRNKLKEEARNARRGLWSMPNPVPPWSLGDEASKNEVAKVADADQPPHVAVHRVLTELPKNSHSPLSVRWDFTL